MDRAPKDWHFADMTLVPADDPAAIPAFALYGEARAFPDILHIERITDRAAGLDWKIAPHRHLHLHQVFLIESGAVRLTLDGGTPRVTPPALLNVPAGAVHGFTLGAGTEGWVLTVPVQNLPDLGPLRRAAVLPVPEALPPVMQAIAEEHRAARPGRAVLLGALAAQVACLVLRLPGLEAGPAPGADPRVPAFQALVAQHLRDRWTLADYAGALGLSERHLSRLCRAATGQPAARLIEAAVMQEACRLLVYTRLPVAQVGYALGFDDPSYFSRAFRRATGHSPAGYRAGYDGT